MVMALSLPIFLFAAAVVAAACCMDCMAKATGQARDAAAAAARAIEAHRCRDCRGTPAFANVFEDAAGRGDAGSARLTPIDPIQAWINAERRLIGLHLFRARWRAAKSCGTEIPQLSRYIDG
jgi:hypothetical protein